MGRSDKSHVGMMHCFYCGDGYGVAFDRYLRDSLPHAAVYSMAPCPRCESVMESGGMIVIGTTTSEEAIERQRLDAKREWDSFSALKKKRCPFNFVPNINRLGVVGLSADGAQRFSDATNGAVKPGRWAFVSEEVWNALFADAVREHEQSQESTG